MCEPSNLHPSIAAQNRYTENNNLLCNTAIPTLAVISVKGGDCLILGPVTVTVATETVERKDKIDQTISSQVRIPLSQLTYCNLQAHFS